MNLGCKELGISYRLSVVRGGGGCEVDAKQIGPENSILFKNSFKQLCIQTYGLVVYDRNHYFSLGAILKPKSKMSWCFQVDTVTDCNHISKGEI